MVEISRHVQGNAHDRPQRGRFDPFAARRGMTAVCAKGSFRIAKMPWRALRATRIEWFGLQLYAQRHVGKLNH
jgi:hypothetical protein